MSTVSRKKVCVRVCVVSMHNSPLLTQKAKFKWSAAYSVAISLFFTLTVPLPSNIIAPSPENCIRYYQFVKYTIGKALTAEGSSTNYPIILKN